MKQLILSGLLLVLTLTSCANNTTTLTPAVPTAAIELTRYATDTLTPTVTSTPANAPTATLAPTQTPTPRAYSIKNGDTMSVIAFRNGLTLEELKAANPGVDPYTLSVGMTLYIPAPANFSATAQASTPTPVPLTVGAVDCLTTTTGGQYCFALVNNGQDFTVSNISAEFRLTNPLSGEVLTRPATLPAARIGAGSSTVLFAFFAPPVFSNPKASLQILTASEAGSGSTNNPVVSVVEPSINIAADGLSALVSGQAVVDAESVDASMVWVTAAAFDESGAVVGVRRVELSGGIKAGSSATFEVTVYSLGGKIDRVELYPEAIP